MRTLTNNFRTGVVTRVTRDNGHPAYDVRLNAGAIYSSVPIAMRGRSHFPVAVGDTVHLVFPEGKYDLPYIVGSDPSTIAESTPNATETSDYDSDQLDLVLRHINETLSLSASGTTIDATTTSPLPCRQPRRACRSSAWVVAPRAALPAGLAKRSACHPT